MKIRRGKKADGTPGRANRRLEGRIRAWERIPDTERKAFRKPGALK